MTEQGETVLMISLSKIKPDSDQPRKFFDEEDGKKLAESINKYGLLQPILGRSINDPLFDYVIIHGERRYRAHKQLGLDVIKAIIWEKRDYNVKDLQLIENVQRKNLSDIELSWEFRRRIAEGQTQGQIAEVIGKNRTYVTQRFSLLKLSVKDQQRVLHGDLTFSQARALLSVKTLWLRQKISSIITSDLTLKQTLDIIKDETVTSQTNVTRVTSDEYARVSELSVWAAIHDEKGHAREIILKTKLKIAIVDDLVRLNRSSD